jgi:hypothetical protein
MPVPSPVIAAGLLLVATMALSQPVEAQALSGTQVYVTGGYSRAFAFADGASWATGPSAAARAHAPIYRGLGVSARFGLDRLRVHQHEPIQRWDWAYWEVLWATWSEIYRSNPNMEGDFRPVQNANLVSAAIGPSFTLGAGRFDATLWAAPSLTYYTRTLYNEETWSRYYPSIEHTFSYTIRNYAPDKTGTVLGAEAGLNARYQLVPWLSLGGGVSFRRLQLEATPELPLNDVISLDLGFSVTY